MIKIDKRYRLQKILKDLERLTPRCPDARPGAPDVKPSLRPKLPRKLPPAPAAAIPIRKRFRNDRKIRKRIGRIGRLRRKAILSCRRVTKLLRDLSKSKGTSKKIRMKMTKITCSSLLRLVSLGPSHSPGKVLFG